MCPVCGSERCSPDEGFCHDALSNCECAGILENRRRDANLREESTSRAASTVETEGPPPDVAASDDAAFSLANALIRRLIMFPRGRPS